VGASGDAGTVDHSKTVGLTGDLASGQAGTVSRGETLLALMGVSARGEIQTLGVARDIPVSGSEGSVSVGDAGKTSTTGLSGVYGQGSASQVIVPLNSQTTIADVGFVGLTVTIALTGVQGRGASGTPTVAPRLLGITGTAASGLEGDVIAVYWKPIDDTQDPNWQNIQT
jgi:hypothetical protein